MISFQMLDDTLACPADDNGSYIFEREPHGRGEWRRVLEHEKEKGSRPAVLHADPRPRGNRPLILRTHWCSNHIKVRRCEHFAARSSPRPPAVTDATSS